MVCWIVNQYIATPDMAGGSRHYELAKVLANKGHEVVLVCARRNKKERLYYKERRDGFTIIWINVERYYGRSIKRIYNMLLFAILVLGLNMKIRTRLVCCNPPDIIIGSSVHPFGAYAALMLSQFYGARFIFEVRDLWPQTFIDMGVLTEKNLFTKFMRWMEGQLCKRSIFIITVLPFAHEYFGNKYKIEKTRVRWLPNGVSLDLFPEDNAPEGKDFQITYVGSFGIANALEAIIEAAKIVQEDGHRNVFFNFYGEGPLKNNLWKRVKELGLNQVSFENKIPKGRLHKVASYTNAFVVNLKDLAVYNYGISLNKLYEYMAMGRPTIIASCARNNPIKEAGAGISVQADDPKAIADGIRILMKMPKKEIDLMGKNGRKYIREYHEYVVLGEKLESWLKEALESV